MKKPESRNSYSPTSPDSLRSPRHRPRDEREAGRARRRPSAVGPGWVILASHRNPDGRRRRKPGERGRRNPRKPRKRPKKPSRRELVRDNGGVPERAAARVRSAVVRSKQLRNVDALRARKGAPRGGWYRRVRRFNNHQGWLSAKGNRPNLSFSRASTAYEYLRGNRTRNPVFFSKFRMSILFQY